MHANEKEIPEYTLELIPVDENAKNGRVFSKYCWEELGKRFKIGGKPNFIQNREYPKCSCCHKDMIFYAQLDTVGDRYDIGDSGLIYIFYCFDCNEVEAMVQSY
jgi:hypothetical protein